MPEPANLPPTIIHCDMDAFYAAVEQRDDPRLAGRPVIVGGSVKRGVVSACSYEARGFGVHSALPMATALRRCPGAVVRPVRMERYREVSGQVFAIFSRFTDRIEPLSIDEAFLNVAGCERLFGTAPEIATQIRLAVRNELGLAVSAGIGPNKFIAKLASARAKPDGLLEVPTAAVPGFLAPLPVTALWGIGAVTAGRLEALGIRTVAELRSWPPEHLVARFGESGRHLYELARGIDHRPLQLAAEPKSISHEETFPSDLAGLAVLNPVLQSLAERVAARLRRQGLAGVRITVKLRFADFTTQTRSRTLAEPVDSGAEIFRVARELLATSGGAHQPLRLLGVGVSGWGNRAPDQPSLFPGEDGGHRRRALDQAVDRLHRRFGPGRVGPADVLAGATAPSGDEEGPDGGEGTL